MGKLEAVLGRCKQRGGDCPCVSGCQALDFVHARRDELNLARIDIDREIARLDNQRRRLESPMANLVVDIRRDGLEPVMVFDGDEAIFGWEDQDGEWNEGDWPFDREWVWPDDCERLGIRVE